MKAPSVLRAVSHIGMPALVLSLASAASPVLDRVEAQQSPSAGKRALTFDDFAAIPGVSDPQTSPDGRSVLYAVRSTNVDANRRATTTYVATVPDGSARAFPDDTTHATEARWSPDGRRVAFISGGQLWIADANGSNRRRLTSLTGGASGPVWSPTGTHIAIVSGSYPDCRDDACNAAREKTKSENKVKAHVAEQLLYRHWNAWDEGTRSHLFVVSVSDGMARDRTPGVMYDVPPGPFGGSEGYAWSPDGLELAYSAKNQGRADAWTTDINVYTVARDEGAPVVITASNQGADENPVYSPDGRFIAYQSQARAGFEADRWRLMLHDRRAKQSRELLPMWDRNADSYFFTPDARAVYVTSVDASRNKLFRAALDANGKAIGRPTLVISGMNNAAFSPSADGRTITWMRDATNRPAEVYTASLDANGKAGAATQLTHYTDAVVGQLALNPAEDFWFKGAGGDSVQGMLLKPPGWQAGRKYPVILLIHGGPQGEWLDSWHGRWNYQMFAAPGNALVIINPRGSIGYGQKFVDGVSKDWGGKVYTDLMSGLDVALARNHWLDSTRMGAAGGSFGGYMVDWIAGHSRRFKALASHAGPFNLENMYGATEELWFAEWEYGGPFWNNAAMQTQYRKYSPHLYAKNFHTPTLVTHGELDYRVPYTEGLSMFTALQRQGVPSRLVVFPDEGHWIGKPQNQRLWWSEMQGWFSKYLSGARM